MSLRAMPLMFHKLPFGIIRGTGDHITGEAELEI
jgi:hypothetical protein